MAKTFINTLWSRFCLYSFTIYNWPLREQYCWCRPLVKMILTPLILSMDCTEPSNPILFDESVRFHLEQLLCSQSIYIFFFKFNSPLQLLFGASRSGLFPVTVFWNFLQLSLSLFVKAVVLGNTHPLGGARTLQQRWETRKKRKGIKWERAQGQSFYSNCVFSLCKVKQLKNVCSQKLHFWVESI